ncbi:MAG: hypothetical protein AAGA53_11300 [Pseudomonadota bacterium]
MLQKNARVAIALAARLAAGACLLSATSGHAGDFSLTLGTNPNWPVNGLGPVNFTMTDQFGFELDGTAQITRFGGAALTGWPDETAIFGTTTSVGVVYDAALGNSGVGESTNTATLSFSSGGAPFAVDSVSFIISDIDSVDNNSTTDRCDYVTVTGDNGNPTLSFVSTNPATRSVILGPGPGSGATAPLAANQAQCVYNTGPTASPNSTADDNGSILAVWPAGTTTTTVAYDESIEDVLGSTSLNAAARGIGLWASSAIVVNQTVSLAKVADRATYTTSGQSINYTYTVTNDGPLPINTGQNVQINDDRIGIINCPAIGSDIPVGGTLICNANYITTVADASADDVENIAVAGVGTGAQSFATRLQSNNASATVIREIPAITLSKGAGIPTVGAGASATLTDGGDTIAYTYTVTNTGNVPIENVTITDPGPTFDGNAGTGTLSAFSPASATIPVGGNQVFTATYTLSQTDVDNSAGVTNGVSNTANSSGTSAGGVGATSNNSNATTTISGGPAITVTKQADQTTNVPAGVTVTYTYRVTNTGNQTISNISLSDTHNGSGPDPTPGGETLSVDNGTIGDSTDGGVNGIWDSLAPGDEVTFTASYTVTQTDIDTLQ